MKDERMHHDVMDKHLLEQQINSLTMIHFVVDSFPF